jgi:glycosyltransferase involved in cell wall biosynthesis
MAVPEVTVVIPTRDRWPRLEPTLRGALRQEDVSLEVVVVDDGSVDETPARLAEMKDPRLRVLRHDSSRGVAAARNAALATARGDWIAFLDDDDLWAPAKLRKQLSAAGEAQATWVYSGAIVLDERLTVLDVYEAPTPAELADMLLAYNAVPAGASNVMARADAIRAVGGYDETLSQLADWDLWIRLALAGPPAACQEPLMAYVQHSSGMLVSDKSGLIDEFERLEEKYREASEQRGIELDRVGLVRWMAWGDSRGGRRVQAAGGYLHAMALYARRGKLWSSGANLRDAIGALLGEQQTDSGRRPPRSVEATPPAWVDLYR